MAIGSAQGGGVSTGSGLRRALLGAAATVTVAIVLVAVAALVFSGVTLAGDSTALARVTVPGGPPDPLGLTASPGRSCARRWS